MNFYFAILRFEEEFKNVPEMMDLKTEMLSYLEVMELSADSADSWYDVSASNINGYYIREGDQDVAWKTRAYGTILDILMVCTIKSQGITFQCN